MRTRDGRTLAWREVGSGPPLLIHPGGPGCSSRHFGELPELEAERTLLLLDPRGTGDSDKPRDDSGYDLEDYAADVEAVREHLALERLDLLGHSHGGFVAMVWAGTYPDRVDRLILANTAPRFTDALRTRRMERATRHQGQPYFEDAIAALQAQQAGSYATDDELVALYQRAVAVMAPVGADISPIAEAFRRSGFNSRAIKHFNGRIAGGMDLRPRLARIESPTLVIACEHDAFNAATDEIAAALPNGTVATIPGADHFAYLEPGGRAPWSRAALDFLAVR